MKSLIHQYIAMPVRSMVVAALQVESFILLTARLTVAERNQMIRSVMEWCQRFVNERKGGIVSYIDRGGFAIVFFSQEYSFHSILQLIEKLSHADPGVNHSNHVSLAINYINIYYHDPISLDQAADKAGVGAYLSRYEKLEKFQAAIEKNPFLIILLARLIPVIPQAVVNVIPAITSIPVVTFAVASALGKIPAMLLYAFIGSNLLAGTGKLVLSFGVYALFLAIVYAVYRLWLKKRWL